MEQPPPKPPGDAWVPSWSAGGGESQDDDGFQLTARPPEPEAPAPEPPRARMHPAVWVITGVVAAVFAVSVVAAAAYLLAQVRGGNLERMVPDSVDVYAAFNLSPPPDQAANLLILTRKFPDLGDQKALEKRVTDFLQPYGVDYAKDVKPWLGAEAVIVEQGGKGDSALLLDSRDDQKAQLALGMLKTGPKGGKLIWREDKHLGVAVSVGTGGGQTWVLAYFDRTAVVSNSETLVDQVIDSDQGKSPRLSSSAEFQKITGRLPSSRLATVYVNGAHLADRIKGLTAPSTGAPAPALPAAIGINPLTPPDLQNAGIDAYKAFAAALTARPDGLATDFEVDVDTSKLPAAQRRLLQQSHHGITSLGWMPAGAAGVLATDELDTMAKAYVEFLQSSSPSTASQLQQEGLTGPGGAIDDLTGQFAAEVSPTATSFDIGAVIGTKDPASLASDIQRLVPGVAAAPVPYKGVQIASAGTLYYGAAGDYLLVGSSLAAVERLVDAHEGTSPISSDTTYHAAQAYQVDGPDLALYIDVAAAEAAATRAFGSPGAGQMVTDTSRYQALKAVYVTGRSSSDGSGTSRAFFLIR